jgi:cyclophilin family peptidyl-prolyl cis-trans isomerase
LQTNHASRELKKDRGRIWVVILFCALVAALTVSCKGNKNSNAGDDESDDSATGNANIKKGVKPQADQNVAVIDTDFGPIVIELYSNVAPQMVQRFTQLASDGTYAGTTFHRINPDLGIIQGGDPLSKDNNPANDGTGSSSLPNLPAEFSDVPYDRGIVGAARSQSNDSANCQFFITLKRVPDFDGRYTVFGKVIQGLDVANIIAGAPVETGTERPAEKIVIKSIKLEPRSKYASQ